MPDKFQLEGQLEVSCELKAQPQRLHKTPIKILYLSKDLIETGDEFLMIR